jgi:predicted AlkP superfamily phosphohydrolase/phosphomutase
MSFKKKRSLLKCDCSAKRINGGVCTCEVDLVVEEEEKDLEEITTDDTDDTDDSVSDSDSIFDDDSILNRPSI